MGGVNIPLVALEGQQRPAAVQPIDPLDEYLKASQYKAQAQQMQQSAAMAPLQQQDIQQQIQQRQLANQQQQIALQTQQTLQGLQKKHVTRDSTGKPTGFDFDGFYNEAIQSGVPASAVEQLQQSHMTHQEAALKLTDAQRASEDAKNKQLYEHVESLRGIKDPAQRQATYQGMVMDAAKKGQDISSWPTQVPDDQGLTDFEGKLGMHAQVLSDAKTQSEITKNLKGEVSQQELNSYLTAPKVPMESLPPDQRTPASFAAWKAKMAPALKLDLANHAADPDIEVAAQALVDPKNLTALKDIASMRGDQRLKIFARARELDPTFDPGLVQRRVDFVKNYENPSGRAALNRQAINNILQHAGDLSDLNQQYRRANVRVINTPLNEIANQFGNTDYTKFSTTNSVLKDELALYFSGGYAPQSDQIATWNKIQSDTATPAQTEAFAKEVVHLGLRRATTFNSQFHKMMGYDDPNMIIPEAKDAANKLGMGSEVSKFGSGGEYGQGAPKEQQQTNKPNSGKFDWNNMPQHQ